MFTMFALGPDKDPREIQGTLVSPAVMSERGRPPCSQPRPSSAPLWEQHLRGPRPMIGREARSLFASRQRPHFRDDFYLLVGSLGGVAARIVARKITPGRERAVLRRAAFRASGSGPSTAQRLDRHGTSTSLPGTCCGGFRVFTSGEALLEPHDLEQHALSLPSERIAARDGFDYGRQFLPAVYASSSGPLTPPDSPVGLPLS